MARGRDISSGRGGVRGTVMGRGRTGVVMRGAVGRFVIVSMPGVAMGEGLPVAGMSTTTVRSLVGTSAAEKVLYPAASQTIATGFSDRGSSMG